MTLAPSFSIIMPTYQRRDMVCEAVRALSRLSYDGSIEIIVVIDGSTDGSLEAARSHSLPVPCQVLWQVNSGAAAARNRGHLRIRTHLLIFHHRR